MGGKLFERVRGRPLELWIVDWRFSMTNSKDKGKPIDRLPEAIGEVAMAWSGLEYGLILILAELLETRPDSAQILGTMLGYRGRRDLITSLKKLKIPRTARSNDPLEAALSEMKGLNSERNAAVHALWFEDRNTSRVTRITLKNQGRYEVKKMPIAPGHIHSVANRIGDLANKLPDLANQIRRDVRAWRRKNPSPTPPHLPQTRTRRRQVAKKDGLQARD
jgi:hypothetical protein